MIMISLPANNLLQIDSDFGDVIFYRIVSNTDFPLGSREGRYDARGVGTTFLKAST